LNNKENYFWDGEYQFSSLSISNIINYSSYTTEELEALKDMDAQLKKEVYLKENTFIYLVGVDSVSIGSHLVLITVGNLIDAF